MNYSNSFSQNAFSNILIPHTFGIIFSVLIMHSGKIGVCVFFMISGFFSVRSAFTTKKMFRLWKICFFYSIFNFGIGLALNPTRVENLFDSKDGGSRIQFFADLIVHFFPIIHQEFWFVTTYIIVLAMSPFINSYLLSISKCKFIFLLVFWSLAFYTINTWFTFGTLPPQQGASLGILNTLSPHLHVCTLFYMAGAYFRLHPPKRPKTLALVFFIVGLVVEIPFLWWLFSGAMQTTMEYLSRENQSINIFLFSIAIFLIFSLIKIDGRPAKLINALSKNVLEVYLFHMCLFSVFMFTVRTFIVKIPGFDPAYWFTFSKLEVFGFFFSILVFFLCIGFVEIRIRTARTIFGLKPFQTTKSKFMKFLG